MSSEPREPQVRSQQVLATKARVRLPPGPQGPLPGFVQPLGWGQFATLPQDSLHQDGRAAPGQERPTGFAFWAISHRL